MARKLKEYRAKRDFDRTTEPSGAGDDGREPAGGGRFVVHQHDARNLHWDLRLEHRGVLLSWALPRGIPQLPDRAANRLAVHTEDHPLEYIDFHGEIPAGEYGAGEMTIWDSGTYEAQKLRKDEVIATFEGGRLRGRYALFQTRGKNWMIHRMDPPADPERVLIPDDLRPMLPRRGSLPRNESKFGYEIAWGGLRTMLWCEPGHIRKAEAHGLDDPIRHFPELRRIARVLGSTEAVLDGELVVLDDEGRPDRTALRERKRSSSESAARRLSSQKRATLMLFDLPFVDGRSLLELPYEERRGKLDELKLDGEAWQTPSYHRGDGKQLLAAAGERRLAGLVAKRLDSHYEPGRRSDAWVKVDT
ncbi:MAG: DNA polymerase ligase N-terminal domain-containing protein [Solirubrobacterales bacterium]